MYGRAILLGAVAFATAVVPSTTAQAATRLPDLVVTSASATLATPSGGPIVVRYTVANRGRRTARAARTGFFLSRDAVRDRRDLVLRDASLKRLRRAAKRAGTARLAVPRGRAAPGLRVIVCADHRRRVRERSERNNCRATARLRAPATPPPPRLPVTAPAAPAGPPPAVTPPSSPLAPVPAGDRIVDSPGVVTIEGVSATAFNPTASVVRFVLTGARFVPHADAVLLTLNGSPVAPAKLTVDPGQVTFAGPLVVGRNELTLATVDQEGRNLEAQIVAWAGDRTLNVDAVTTTATAVPGAAVTVTLGDDDTVTAQATANGSGRATFQNVPDRTVVLHGTAAGDLAGTSGTTGGAGTASLVLYGFNAPSTVDNGDFSQGTAGWEVGSAPVNVSAHPAEEEESTGRRAGDPDMDLVLSTSGEGQEHVSRTFTVEEDVESVTVRYRFITSEVPGGYFGTKYNDYFSVNIRSQGADGAAVEANSMNGLGLGSFTAGGATAWREEVLEVDGADTVQVDVSVANVADGAYDSQVAIDVVEEKKLAISSLELRDTQVIYDSEPVSAPLDYLSVSPHTHFGGFTRIWGTITVKGAADDTLTSLELEVIESGKVKAKAQLTAGLKPVLYQAFGDDKQVSVTVNQLLFSLPSADTSDIDQAANGTLLLRARVKSEKTEKSLSKEYPKRPAKLVLHTNPSRYGDRNESEGGDAWVKPTIKPLIESYSSVEWGDSSNMNGGPISPHREHRTGNDIDAWYTGYSYHSGETQYVDGATAANKMVQLLNAAHDRGYSRKIERVLVTYCRPAPLDYACGFDPSLAFWTAIETVVLSDGRNASEVIIPAGGHNDHFHWDIAN